jgi:protein O-GlcNAc transferase
MIEIIAATKRSESDFWNGSVDFCRTARSKGLFLGTWPICLTHQSKGMLTPQWEVKSREYLEKWKD